MNGFNTPILFLIYNRPETTSLVFQKIREIKPKYLYVAADGVNSKKPQDELNCKTTRDILKLVDWDCDLQTLFRNENLGCGRAVSEAITWFFEKVEMGIILEDDCLPSAGFFPFCQVLLERYRNNDNVFVISGNNFQNKNIGEASYYFSAYGPIWGWATWKRAWKYYDFTLSSFSDEQMLKDLKNYFTTKQELEFWNSIYQMMRYQPIDTWDYQWVFTQWKMHAINIMPNSNLVSNIGFNLNGTHTKGEILGISNCTSHELTEINHPISQKINRKADVNLFKIGYHRNNKKVFFDKIKKMIFNIGHFKK